MTTHEPGCGEPWVCEPCETVNDDIRQKCRICKQPREKASAIIAQPTGDLG
jgi:recombinational DNA repair protein RecR